MTTLFLLAAFVVFVLACFGIHPGGAPLIPLEGALLTAAVLSWLPWPWPPKRP